MATATNATDIVAVVEVVTLIALFISAATSIHTKTKTAPTWYVLAWFFIGWSAAMHLNWKMWMLFFGVLYMLMAVGYFVLTYKNQNNGDVVILGVCALGSLVNLMMQMAAIAGSKPQFDLVYKASIATIDFVIVTTLLKYQAISLFNKY